MSVQREDTTPSLVPGRSAHQDSMNSDKGRAGVDGNQRHVSSICRTACEPSPHLITGSVMLLPWPPPVSKTESCTQAPHDTVICCLLTFVLWPPIAFCVQSQDQTIWKDTFPVFALGADLHDFAQNSSSHFPCWLFCLLLSEKYISPSWLPQPCYVSPSRGLSSSFQASESHPPVMGASMKFSLSLRPECLLSGLSCAKSLQLCPTICNPMDCSPPGSSIHGILQARILEWVAVPSSRGSSWPRDPTVSYISCIGKQVLSH